MKTAFHAGVSGLMAYQESLNVIGNNIANVNTYGYKPQTLAFEDLLYGEMYANTDKKPLSGHGVRAVSTGIAGGMAELSQTGSEMDFAATGNGWFAVENGGEKQYTRDGCFSVSITGANAYLVTQDGAFVLDKNGKQIALERDEKTGSYSYETLPQRIGLVEFANANGLQPVSANRYAATQTSGNAQAVKNSAENIRQGYLERSGVKLPDEMLNLIQAQRAYQISARVVQVADENEQTVNGLRK